MELDFFGRLATEVAMARQHRYVLLSTLPEWLPLALDAILGALSVAVLSIPQQMDDLLPTVAMAAGRLPDESEDESVG